jgi:hypothetical protein
MSTTSTLTVRDIITQALRKSGLLGFGDEADDDDADAAKDELNVMLKSWQNKGYNLWTKTSGTLTLTTSAAHQMTPERPLKILSARFKRNGLEIPMTRMMRDEYDTLPDKTTTGTPTQFYYDRQREDARLYVWPLLSSASGETIEYTYEREIEDVSSLNDVIDVPGEWWDAVIYNLAARLQESAPRQSQSQLVPMRAQALLQEAGAFDREESVFFAGELAE